MQLMTEENTPAAPARSSKWLQRISMIIIIGFAVISLMIYLGRSSMMGTKLAVTEKESVNYSGSATEADAKVVGEVLKEIKYFNNETEKDVLLKKDEKAGTVVSFVVVRDWNDEKTVADFKWIGETLAEKIGKPLVIKLIDPTLNTKNEFRLE